MTIIPLSEIAQHPKGTLILATKGQIKEVGTIHSGEHAKYGPWTVQTIKLMDATGKVTAKFFSRGEMTKDWVGQWVYLECSLDGKGKSNGVIVDEDTYRGVTSKVLKVNEHAVVTQASVKETQPAVVPPATNAPAAVAPPIKVLSPEAKPPHTTSPAFAQPSTKIKPGSREDKAEAVRKARHHLAQMAVAMEISYDAVIYLAKRVEKKHGVTFTIAELEKMAVSFNIGLDRAGLFAGLPANLDALENEAAK